MCFVPGRRLITRTGAAANLEPRKNSSGPEIDEGAVLPSESDLAHLSGLSAGFTGG